MCQDCIAFILAALPTQKAYLFSYRADAALANPTDKDSAYFAAHAAAEIAETEDFLLLLALGEKGLTPPLWLRGIPGLVKCLAEGEEECVDIRYTEE